MSGAVYIVEVQGEDMEWYLAPGTSLSMTPGIARRASVRLTADTRKQHRVARYDFTAVVHPNND